MINAVTYKLFIIIIIPIILYEWLLLPTCAINSLQTTSSSSSSSSRIKLLPEKIHKRTIHKEFVLNNSSNIFGNLLNRDKNTVLLNYSTPPTTPAAGFNTTSSQIFQTNLKELKIAANDENAKIHNDFYYGINKTNQENNSNKNKKQPTTTPSLSNNKFVNTSTLLSPSSSSSSSSSSTSNTPSASGIATEPEPEPVPVPVETHSYSSTESSYFERVEMHETLTHTKNEKLLLHRNKRYLLFPEGSSFQLVFDLIIPIVDYTNFAIMGITCAVAWELPSKPPSEIIENFRQKLNDGTFGLSRRNDSTQQPLEYINSLRTQQQQQQAHEPNQNYLLPSYQPHQQQQLSATISTTSGHKNYLSYAPKPLPLPLPPSSNFYYNNNYMQRPSANSTIFFYDQHPQQQQQQQQQWHNNNFETFDNNQRKTLYQNDLVSQANERIYYKNDDDDHHHHHYHYHPVNKWPSQQMIINYKKMVDKGNKDNWWERNKKRIVKHWQKNKPKWTQYQENPQMNYQTPLFSKRTSRNRKILNKRPKHLIYPIFGKRRRRRRSSFHNDDFSITLESIHTREHLQTRQKLYGKIEKLYETRGQNGTACILRALCETERIHLNVHYNAAPQSFVMELLRSIFALPKDTLTTNSKESLLHLDDRYVNAVMMAHDVTQSCRKNYYDCEYSISYGT